MFKEYFTNMTLKRLTNTVFLVISICLSVYFLWFNSKFPLPRTITTMCAVFFEIGMRYELALARTKFKIGFRMGWRGILHVLGALILLIFYGCYICYNITTMAGFFITEIVYRDQIAIKAEANENQKLTELRQLNETIDSLNKALAVEVETSFRSKSEELETKLEKAKGERSRLLATMVLTKEDEVIEKNPSRSVAEAAGIPLGTMLCWIYGFFGAGICLLLIITSEDLPDETAVNTATDNVTAITNKTSTDKTVVTDNEKTNVTGKKKCKSPVCANWFAPVRSDQEYCNDKCRHTAWVMKQKGVTGT